MEGDRAVALAEGAGDIGALVERLEDAAVVRDRLARLPGPVARPGSMAGDGGPLATSPASPASPPYILPVVGRIERGFGDVSSDGTRSRGLTLVAPGGAQVVAPARGRVVFAGPFRSFGRIAIIDHGGGWTSLVTGMIAVSARVGDTVDQGAPLGRAGPGQPRIAVELRRAGRPIDVGALLS
jgi:septal ring factor EnvC (AmiA/AmiB activator)